MRRAEEYNNDENMKKVISSDSISAFEFPSSGGKPLRKVRSKDRIPKHIQEMIANRQTTLGSEMEQYSHRGDMAEITPIVGANNND